MARLTVPKVPAFVQEMCRQGGVRLRTFKSAEEFEHEISRFLTGHDILYLSTSKNDAPRCTPVGYFHSGMTVYVLSEGGGKFANLKANPKVSYAVASRIDGRMGILDVRGLQCRGQASLISMRDEPEKFSRLIDELGLTERLNKRGEKLPPFNYRFIRIVPHTMRMLDLREGICNITWTR